MACNGGAIGEIEIDGISCVSRHNEWYEIESMFFGIKNMPTTFRQMISSIFCDSNAQALYEITLHFPIDKCSAELIARSFQDGVFDIKNSSRQHNGISVICCDEILCELSPNKRK